MAGNVILFSGGMDSTVALAYYLNKQEPVMALTIDYGQRNYREIEAAKKVAEYYKVDHYIYKLPADFFTNTALVGQAGEVPKSYYGEIEGMPSTNVPFRNGLFVSIGAACCISWFGKGKVIFGTHKSEDIAGASMLGFYVVETYAYMDNAPPFVNAMKKAVYLGSDERVKLETPFLKWNKTRVASLGKWLEVPFNLTYSCYEGTEKPCGVCPTCRDRTKALEGIDFGEIS